ncbi:8557_t:CDS:10 [Funneliformis geosporum]|uniref:9332_t:CDS:1 n=1 Tax=Funneliformis geosporum TaxID=1117311 RepID=A0A9W4SL69_9GLOM|nr:8557_t:CDS:10 [Funneliformis geosporum]CAI2172670.1 9332_t:CDS:10 [Funneliformis geosporum]
MKRKRSFSVKKGRKNKFGIKKGLGIKKLTRKDKETLEEYGTLNPTELEESESDETEGGFSKKLVGLLQVNKKQKIDEVMKENVEIDKVESKIDDVEINLKNEEHFENQQTLNGKVSMIEQKRWNIINYENSVLNIVSQYTLINNEEKNDHNESDMTNLNSLKIRPKLLETWKKINDNTFTELQWHLFQQFNKYRDVLYTNKNVKDSHQIKCVYALHALNHIFKNRVLKNNEKLNNAHAAGRDIDEIRDQGFTRPKVLILLPFRNSAMDLVEILIKLSGTDQQENRKRFFDSFGITPEQEKIDPKKPADFLATFKGNIDDMFRIGIKFTRKSMKFYAEFYNADIIIASPLGLRMVIGAEGDKKREFDFLSSIEVMIVDQCDTLLMQNWDYVEHIFSHMNLIPQKSHDCDFSRVKDWYLDGRAKYLRQTIVFSDYLTPEINAYSSVSDVTRARTYFLNGKKDYLLYTERFHFFRRNHIKGIHHIIFYALPDHAHFYSELLNFIQLSPSNKTSAIENSNEMISISVLFSKFDQLRLERVIGTSKFCKMLQGEKKIYTFSN